MNTLRITFTDKSEERVSASDSRVEHGILVVLNSRGLPYLWYPIVNIRKWCWVS